jgi:hypothetical protein
MTVIDKMIHDKMIHDKMIHANEFRLRVLLTNYCNKNCSFCLNDFQAKTPTKYAPPFDLMDCIRAYGQFMRSIKQESIITFSGGEPGLHPMLNIILASARHHCNIVKVATNGLALDENHLHYVDKWHVHPTGPDEKIIAFKKLTDTICVQIVVTDKMSHEKLLELVTYYIFRNIPVKLFADFYSVDRDKVFDKIREIMVLFPEVSSRFTGRQINRGPACAGCEKDCVTLKALWYFPDGTASTCPQGARPLYDDDSWDETMDKAYKAHEVKKCQQLF